MLALFARYSEHDDVINRVGRSRKGAYGQNEMFEEEKINIKERHEEAVSSPHPKQLESGCSLQELQKCSAYLMMEYCSRLEGAHPGEATIREIGHPKPC